jgi:3-hydroxyacyl-[acyl-carrier-protein] dehydratase
LVIEALAQSAAWLVMATTDFAQRGVLGTFRQVEIGAPAPVGSCIETHVRVEDWTKEAVVFGFSAQCGGEVVVRVERALCFLIEAGVLEDPAQTRAQYQALQRADRPEEARAPRPAGRRQWPARSQAASWFGYDVVEQIVPEERATAYKSVVMADPVFATHFPRFPVVPGVLLMQSVVELGRELLTASVPTGGRWREAAMSGVKFQHYVRPGDEVEFTVRLLDLAEGRAELTGGARVAGKDVFNLRRVRYERGSTDAFSKADG